MPTRRDPLDPVHASFRDSAEYNLAHALEWAERPQAVQQIVKQFGYDTVIDAMTAIYLYKHHASAESAERVAAEASVFSPLLPLPNKPIYRGLKLDSRKSLARHEVGDVFRLRSYAPLTSWTARKAFAKAWSATTPAQTQMILSTIDVKSPVFLAPLNLLKTHAPALYEILKGMPDAHEDEWLISDVQPLVRVEFVRRPRSRLM